MKNSKLIVAAAVAIGAMLAIGTASAADLAVKAMPYATPAPAFSWTGCYIGGHAGDGALLDQGFQDVGLAGGDHGDALLLDCSNAGAFDRITDPNAPSAQYAAIMVDHETIVGGVNIGCGIAIGVMNVSDIEFLGKSLHLAMAVRDADRADMVALGKEQFENLAAITLQALCGGGNLHAFLDTRHAGGKQFRVAFDFHKAEAACPNHFKSLQFAKGGDEDVVLARDFQDGLVFACADVANAITRPSATSSRAISPPPPPARGAILGGRS